MLKETLGLWSFGFTKIPLLFYCRPRVVRLDDDVTVVRIPLRRRTRNHLGSMYFGALAVGADCAGGLGAMMQIRRTGRPISLVFGGFQAEFLKRPTADVDFTCRDGAAVAGLVQRALASGERVALPVTIVATTPGVSGDEPVARFTLELSLKLRP